MRRGDQFLSILTLPPKTIAISANLGGTDGPQNAPRARPFTRYLVNFGHEQSILVPSFILAGIYTLSIKPVIFWLPSDYD